jgi:hypothetical protein
VQTPAYRRFLILSDRSANLKLSKNNGEFYNMKFVIVVLSKFDNISSQKSGPEPTLTGALINSPGQGLTRCMRPRGRQLHGVRP